MLRMMRDYAGSWVIKIILGAIVIVFVFWGVGTFQDSSAAKIAEVNGEPIPYEQYLSAYNRMLEQYRQRFGKQFNEDMLKMLNLKDQALDQLIDQAIMIQEAEKMEIRVTDAELAETIMEYPAFQNNGAFDNRRYRTVLNANRMTPEEFEIMQRQSMLLGRMRSLIMENVKISDDEIREWYEWDKATVNIDYVLFESDSYKDIVPTDEELQAHYDENRESYKTEEKVKARYLVFTSDAYADRVEITNDEVSAYYDENQDEFKEPKTVEARHILLKVEADSPPETVEEKRVKAEEIMKMAKEGKDFAELAKEYSEGPTKDRGGLLGAFKEGDMVKPFSDKAFSMEPGEISEPVKTRFGWHVIKVEKVNPASEKSLEEAEEGIRKKLTDKKAKAVAFDEAEAVYDSAFEGDDLREVAKPRNLEIHETDYFTRKGPKDVGSAPQFATAAFELSAMQISEVQDFNDGYYLIQMTEKIPSETAPFEDVAEKVKNDLIRKIQGEKAEADAKALMEAVKKGESPESEAEKFRQELKSAGPFERKGSIPEIGYEMEISATAFTLTEENPYPEKPIKGRKGFYVIKFKDRKKPDAEGLEKEKENIRNRLLQQKQVTTFQTWLDELKGNSQITKNETLLN